MKEELEEELRKADEQPDKDFKLFIGKLMVAAVFSLILASIAITICAIFAGEIEEISVIACFVISAIIFAYIGFAKEARITYPDLNANGAYFGYTFLLLQHALYILFFEFIFSLPIIGIVYLVKYIF